MGNSQFVISLLNFWADEGCGAVFLPGSRSVLADPRTATPREGGDAVSLTAGRSEPPQGQAVSELRGVCAAAQLPPATGFRSFRFRCGGPGVRVLRPPALGE